MDSERRNELETNDLREFLDNFKDFWEKHGNKILIFLIVVLGGFAGYNYYNDYQTGEAEDAYNQLAEATTPKALIGLAGEYDMVHDEAMRRAGDLSLSEARVALIADETKKAEKALKQAGSAYTAIAERGKTVEYQLVGHEGLAKVAVMNNDWSKAKSQYNKVIELAGETHPIQAALAKVSIDQLDLYKNPIAFGPEDDGLFNPDDLPDIDTPDTPAPDDTTPEDTGDGGVLPGIDLPDPSNFLPGE